MTGGDLLASACRLIGVLASGETLSGNESADGLLIAQQMMDSWQAERLDIFSIRIDEFPLTPGQQVYTLGTGGNFNLPRPARIERMSIVSLLNPAQPLELPLEMLTEAGWQAVPVKLISSSLPTVVYDDMAFPSRNLSFWCIPTIAVNTRIYSWQPLNTFPDLTTDVTFPPAYIKAIRYNLAVDLAPEFGRSTPPEVAAQAMMTKAMLKTMNAPLIESRIDPVLSGSGARVYNWISDTFRHGA
jgi:hypothetical protein